MGFVFHNEGEVMVTLIDEACVPGLELNVFCFTRCRRRCGWFLIRKVLIYWEDDDVSSWSRQFILLRREMRAAPFPTDCAPDICRSHACPREYWFD